MFRLVRSLFFLLAMFPSAAAAQPAVRLAWDRSSDPAVAGYILDYGTSPRSYTKRIDVGLRTDYLVEALTDAPMYYFVVRAYDRNGATSPPSNELGFEPCPMALSPTRQVFGAQSGAGGFSVSTSDGCTWTLGSSADWLTMSSSSGSGSAAVGYTMTANPSRSPRTAILYSGNRSITVTQGGRVKSDFDGDGRNDLIWQNHSTGELSVWRMRGTDMTSGQYLSPGNVGDSNWKIMGTLDADRDGYTDLLFQHDHGEVAIWRMAGETRIENVVLTASVAEAPPDDSVTGGDPRWRIVGTGDMDRDGFEDIAWQHPDGRVAVWYMDGFERRDEALVATISDSRWRVAALEDFDGDDKLDILWRHTSWGQFLVWNMDDRQYLSSGMHLIMANGDWQVAGAGDFSGDRRPDLIWQNSTTGELAIWVLNGPTVAGSWLLNPGRISDTNWRIAGPR